MGVITLEKIGDGKGNYWAYALEPFGRVSVRSYGEKQFLISEVKGNRINPLLPNAENAQEADQRAYDAALDLGSRLCQQNKGNWSLVDTTERGLNKG
jgi:hypothetical protein